MNKQPFVPTAHRPGPVAGPWQIPVAIALLSIVLSLGGDTLREILRYERMAVADGEVWRLLSAHVVHLGWGHLLLNLAALGVLGSLFEDVLERFDWALVSIVSAFAIDIGLYWFSADVTWYVGMSGVLHGLVAAGGLHLLRLHQTTGFILLLLMTGKLLWEQFGGPVPYSEFMSGGPVVIEAHVYGACGGVAAQLGARFFRRRRGRPL